MAGGVKRFFLGESIGLLDCFSKYCEVERMVGTEQYFCDKCACKTDARKRTMFAEFPQYMVLHLKRFRFEAGWFGNKNMRAVSFPLEELYLGGYK